MKNVFQPLFSAGFEAYLVGGAVRDFLLGLNATDFDVATDARPKQMLEIFPKAVQTGIKHGTITVLAGDFAVEVTTYRVDQGHGDHRHPDQVTFVGSLREDLARRDFTVNALAYDVKKSVIVDPFSGQADLEAKVIRAVGDAKCRFKEDALRVLRAMRFMSQLNFSIEAATLEAMRTHASLLKHVSMERKRDEWLKAIKGIGRRQAVVLGLSKHLLAAYSTSLAEVLEKMSDVTRDRYFQLLDEASEISEVVLLASFFLPLFFEMEGKAFKKELHKLKFSNRQVKFIYLHCAHVLKSIQALKSRESACKYLASVTPECLQAQLAWDLACTKHGYPKVMPVDFVNDVRQVFENIFNEKTPLYPTDLALSGDEVAELAAVSGEKVGKLLQELLHSCWRQDVNNEKHALQKILRERLAD